MNKKPIVVMLLLFSGLLIAYPILYFEYIKFQESNETQNEINLPQGIRITIVDKLDTSVGISWYSTKNASDPKVEYSKSADFGVKTSIKANLSVISPYFIYHAKINSLEANTTYFYRVCSDNQNRRDKMNFTTLATNLNITRFLAYGDSRTLRIERKMVAEAITGAFLDRFDFLVHTGDIVADGTLQEQWNNYFDDTEMLNRYKQGIFVEGNHERGGSSDAKMYDNLLMNSTSAIRYYAFSYNEMGFIILNSNPYAAGDDEQTEWLNATLNVYAEKNVFNFVYLHHPLLHEDRTDQYFLDNWRPLFDEYNVSIVFCGHNHHYERSYPMENSTTLEEDNSKLYNYSNLTDPIYIVAGGAGAPLYDVADDPFIAYAEKAYNFVLVEVEKTLTNTTLTLEAWKVLEDSSGCELMDNITIIKSN